MSDSSRSLDREELPLATEYELLRIAERVEAWYDGQLSLSGEEAATEFAEYIGRLLGHLGRQLISATS
jgi:hypothetical protein